MMPANWDVEWGGWVLGDLADVLRRAADLLGRSQDVTRVELIPPTDDSVLPHITITVPDEPAVLRVRRQIVRGEYLVEFFTERRDRWTAEAAGFVLTVTREGE
jgi:hypothetical protein